MKSLNKSLLSLAAIGAAALIAGLIGILLFKNPVPVQSASFVNAPAFTQATTSAGVAVTSSTRILATTTNPLDPTNSYTRAYAIICNPSTSTPVYLRMDRDKPASLTTGIPIASIEGFQSCYEITDKMLYQGSVTASSTNQTSVTVTVNQYVF